jgi:thioredoxin 1
MAEFIKDEAEFETRLATGKVLVVDCTATWCGPCKLVAPLIDRLMAEYSDRADICKLDVEPNRALAKKLGIRNIPAVIFFKAGEKVQTIVGVKAYEEFSCRKVTDIMRSVIQAYFYQSTSNLSNQRKTARSHCPISKIKV